MFTCVIYLILTVAIPLKLTHHSLSTPTYLDNKLWAVYWSIFATFKGLQWNCWLLDYPVVHLIFGVLAIWLYHENYRGGLLVAQILEKIMRNNKAIADNINMISVKIKFLNLFEKAPVFEDKTE